MSKTLTSVCLRVQDFYINYLIKLMSASLFFSVVQQGLVLTQVQKVKIINMFNLLKQQTQQSQACQ